MVLQKCRMLQKCGIKPGCNLLVRASDLDNARDAFDALADYLAPDQIILIPMRFSDTPTAKQLSVVAGGKPFQSPSCLLECKQPDNFVSVSWDKKVNHCSYAPGKEPLLTLDYEGMMTALSQVQWRSCIK